MDLIILNINPDSKALTGNSNYHKSLGVQSFRYNKKNFP